MNFQEFFKLGMDRDLPQIKDFEKGIILNVGAGKKHIYGAIPLDLPEWNADTDPIPFGDGSVAGIHAYHFLEHIESPINMLREFQRVLIDGGLVNIVVPYYSSQLAYQDLDHKHFFCEETWRVLLHNTYYDKNHMNWSFKIGANFIAGIVEKNLALFTQLEKVI